MIKTFKNKGISVIISDDKRIILKPTNLLIKDLPNAMSLIQKAINYLENIK
jgi:hypothetical protein